MVAIMDATQVNGPTSLGSPSISEAGAEALARTLLADKASDAPSLTCLNAPRRRKDHGVTAGLVARKMYPDLSALQALIQYEHTVVGLRKIVLEKIESEEQARRIAKGLTIRTLVHNQGPWVPPIGFYDLDYVEDPEDTFSRKGVPALPMPVQVSSAETLAPFFDYLKSNQAPTAKPNIFVDSMPAQDSKHGQEPYYGVEMIEFEKGVVYTDNRMDLCKMVVGPQHIETLMDSLSSNMHVRHFLLGNNIIGPHGAQAIAEYIVFRPWNIETWYLAGNMINAQGLKTIVASAVHSQVIHSVWLKRNPLGPQSVETLAMLIRRCSKLRVLDLDQTELSDAGVSRLFSILCDTDDPTPFTLQTIYLNACGISRDACRSIARFLQHPCCRIENLYLSNNPIGDVGAIELARGIDQNSTLKRLTLASCGLGSAGVSELATVLSRHLHIMSVDFGQSIATQDLGTRYNYITDAAVASLIDLVSDSESLKYLNLGTCALSHSAIQQLHEPIASGLGRSSLFFFFAASIDGRGEPNKDALQRMADNIFVELGMSLEKFSREELRWLKSPKDVRFIDSVYRNRDAGKARRGLMVLKKQWDEGDSTMDAVWEFGTGD